MIGRIRFSVAPSAPFRVTIALFSLVVAALTTRAAEVWAGDNLTFVRPIGVDWTLPQNQDRLSDHVWLTRDTTRGLFNAASEIIYASYHSPADTEWAYGQLSDYSSLTYTNWESWNQHYPPGMVGQDAVLHLVTDDVYLGIRFLSWGGPGGDYSYVRTTPVVPEPATTPLMLVGLVPLFRAVWRARTPQKTLRRTQIPRN